MNLKELIDQIIDRKMNNRLYSNIIYAKLKTLTPLTFIPESDDFELKGDFLVVPRYKVFTEDDIGRKFVFAGNDGGQTYFYLYEASQPQGSNGEPYKWRGEIVSCKLKGTCPDGEVTVTNGTIELAIHERRV